MQRHSDGSLTFTQEELASILKAMTKTMDAISSMPSDMDFLGERTWHAMSMWVDLLNGEEVNMDEQFADDDDEDYTSVRDGYAYALPWLIAYGGSDVAE